ncbi:MAG: FAD-dependent oxidoreductase [Syntrophobacterales bacterium]|nr:FAD-dependent oxidoreductase [Syntrophobacterales bacterium]
MNPAKCTACGECAKVCPVSVSNPFNMGLDDCKAVYRLYPQAIPSAFAIKKLDRDPCTLTCPAEINVQGYVQLIKMGKYADAMKLIMERLPLPGVLGRVCPHPCESKCRRQEVDEPVAICSLKRFAADQVDLAGLNPPLVEAKSEKVAIIGAGPAGLTCAYHLARRGYRPTIFEALPKAGGMLRVGIPDYRLPKTVLDQEIDNILRLGVELKTNAALERDFTLDSLTADGYKAVFLGIGCHVGRPLGIHGEEIDGVIQGVEFLRRQNLGEPLAVGKRLAVIGGGNVAIDVACTARRLGSEVTVVYRRSREEMPAFTHEIEQALCEGVEIVYLAAPLKVVAGADGKVAGLICQKMELGEPDPSGRRQPVPIPDATFELPVDMIVPAIGQESAQGVLQTLGVKLTRRGTIEVDEVTYQTSRPGVFAAGDVHTGPWIAVEAVGGGIEAAESIDRYLRGVDLTAGRTEGQEAHKRWAEVPKDEEGQPRELMATLPPEYTCACFDEIAQGFTEEQAQREASRCLNCGVCSECMQCVSACQAGAIEHGQCAETNEINVGSVILAPGFKTFDPAGKYGYGHFPNVYTSIEFERILSPGGPYHGHIQRRSDGKEPKKIGWIHCVGMRSDREDEHPYCSNFCCMVALKQAVIAREHIGTDLDMALFYMDIRTPRKDFEKYMVRIKDQGARLIRSRVHSVKETGPDGDLEIRYVTETGEIKDEIFDAVVLSVGMVIPPDVVALAEKLEVPLSPNNFVEASCFEPTTTFREGIFSCGAFNGPKDIPQSVMEGSAAAAAATRALAAARGTLARQKEFPAEKDVLAEPVRIGVFVCNCGLNIGGVADVPDIVEYAKSIPDVAYAQDNLFTCSQDSQAIMVEKIREHNLNRVVVAACSPSTHAPIFQDMLRTAGLNKYLFEMANIRNQCTWCHMNEPEAATGKCKDLVNMGVAKARLLKPLEYITMDVNHRALVIGGGAAGMTSALALADQGYQVDLVERKDRLGGNALKLHTTWRGGLVKPRLTALMNKVLNQDKITIHYNALVEEVHGVVGNFTSRLSTGVEINHGIVVIAIGGVPYRPEGEYLYKQNPNVLLALDMDREIMEQSERLKNAQAAAFIQCVGSRSPERPYCNKVCCAHSVENAIKLKTMHPDMDVYILYRDMRTYGERESLYQRARELGVIFIRFLRLDPPKVEEADGRLKITVQDQILERPVSFSVDLVTLATAIIPHQNAPLAELYKIPLNAEGFFTEAHAKIRPVEASTEGIYLAGLCHYPKPMQESVAEALACASRANTILSKDILLLESIISNPIDENCDGCAFCVDACPFKAITLLEYMKEGNLRKTVEVNPIQCKGCGSCMATCPKAGIYVAGFSPEQLEAQVDAALGLV